MSFSIDLWDQFEEVCRKVSQGKEFAEKVADFMRKRQLIEREYAKKLQSLTKSVDAEMGTLNSAWNQIKEETENISKKHGELAEALGYQVADPISNNIKDYKKKRETLKTQGRKLIKDLADAEKKKDLAKSTYESARRAQDDAKEKYEQATHNNSQSPQIEKLSKKMKEAGKKAETADQKYSASVDACKVIQDKYYDEEMPRVLAELESTEKARIECLKEALVSYVKLQESVIPEVQSACSRMIQGVDKISPDADLKQYVVEKRTNNPKPPRAEYEPYDSAQQRCVGGAGPSSGGSGSGGGGGGISSNSGSVSSVSSSSAQMRSAANVGGGGGGAARAAPAAAPAVAAAPRGIGRCQALFDYEATDSNELSFKQGEMITILQKDASGWWQGELNGVVGVFPSVDWVQEVDENATAAAPMGQCRALYPYQAENEYELTIQAGEVLTVENEEEGWYCGTNSRNQYGRFPSNYVQWI